MSDGTDSRSLPRWVPDPAQHYLLHTEVGQSIRDIARQAGCYASTIMRQIRKIESRRDDPLVDAALTTLADAWHGRSAPRDAITGRAITRKKDR
jgi:hypothetical protein